MDRLTARRADNGLAYLVGVKPNEQEVDSPHPNTLRCILDCFERLATYEDIGLMPDEIEIMFRAHTALRDMKNKLLTDIKQVKAERDAAVADLKNATTNRPKTCRHYAECYQKCYEAIKIMPCVTCNKWQWRGPEKEGRA